MYESKYLESKSIDSIVLACYLLFPIFISVLKIFASHLHIQFNGIRFLKIYSIFIVFFLHPDNLLQEKFVSVSCTWFVFSFSISFAFFVFILYHHQHLALFFCSYLLLPLLAHTVLFLQVVLVRFLRAVLFLIAVLILLIVLTFLVPLHVVFLAVLLPIAVPVVLRVLRFLVAFLLAVQFEC